jgi:hypothetical protein
MNIKSFVCIYGLLASFLRLVRGCLLNDKNLLTEVFKIVIGN